MQPASIQTRFGAFDDESSFGFNCFLIGLWGFGGYRLHEKIHSN